MKIRSLYECDICGHQSKDEDEIIACEAQGRPTPSVQVGDIVLLCAAYCWFNGEVEWVSNPHVKLKTQGAKCPKGYSNCFSKCCTYEFYYVVTAIDTEDQPGSHRIRYHVFTKAIRNDKDPTKFRNGYTFDSGHYTPKKVRRPPKAVVDSARDLLGRKADHLL